MRERGNPRAGDPKASGSAAAKSIGLLSRYAGAGVPVSLYRLRATSGGRPLDPLLTPRGRLVCCCDYIILDRKHIVKVCFTAFSVNITCYARLSMYIARFLRFPLFLAADTLKYEKTFALLYASGWNRYKLVKDGIIMVYNYRRIQSTTFVHYYNITRRCCGMSAG